MTQKHQHSTKSGSAPKVIVFGLLDGQRKAAWFAGKHAALAAQAAKQLQLNRRSDQQRQSQRPPQAPAAGPRSRQRPQLPAERPERRLRPGGRLRRGRGGVGRQSW